MRWLLLSAFFLTAVMGASGQTATGTTQSLPDDPQKLLAAAEPFYDFNSPELKPWHLKATYQLYDDKGKPSEQGTYEYWWASPQVYRSTWTRKKATFSDWHTADGKHLVLSKGKPLGYFEEGLRSDFVSPLPIPDGPDSQKVELESEFTNPAQGGGAVLYSVQEAVASGLNGSPLSFAIGGATRRLFR